VIAIVEVGGPEGFGEGATIRDCAIRSGPADAALLDHPLVAVFEPWLDDARSAQVVVRGGRATIHVALSPADRLVLDVEASGKGTWRLEPDAVGGPCRPARLGDG
jgi:hypothetical protein